MRILLSLLALLVPRSERPRWREEWTAELQHGRWTMIFGATPDAWAVRRLRPVPPESGRYRRHPFHALDQDLRYAIRALTSTPAFVLAMLLSLSIGIGANTTAFSFVNAVVFRPFPGVDRQHELVRVSIGTDTPRFFTPAGDYDTLRSSLSALGDLSAHIEATFALLTPGGASFAEGALVSSNYFAVLGVRPAAGTFFADGDDRPWGRPVAVISDKTWTRLFSRDPNIIGRTISVNDEALEIIGITPPDFWGVHKTEERPDVWIPLGLAELTLRDDEGQPAGLDRTRNYWMDYVARVRPGISLEQVNAAAAVLAAQLVTRTDDGQQPSGRASRVWLNDPATNTPAVLAFMIAPLLVLAIACVNAANLMVARTERRARDWVVRLALGASRWRVIRQVLAEALILAGLASGIGVAFARWSLAAIRNQVPVPMPMDARVATFTVGMSVLAALAFTLGPALSITSKAGRTGPLASLRPARSGRRFALIAIQSALSLGLLVTGVQFTRTVFTANPNEASIPSPGRLVVASFDLDSLRMPPEAGQEFYEKLARRARQIPGVSAAGFSTPGLVGSGMTSSRYSPRLWLPDSPPAGQRGFLAMELTPGGLAAIGVPMLRGRAFLDDDARTMDVVVVNRSFAIKFFDGHAIGRTFRLGTAEDPSTARDVTIVGITEGILKRGDQEPAILYHPAPLAYSPAQTLYVRLDDGAAFDTAALHAAVRDTDPRVPVGAASTLAESRASRHVERKLLARGAAALGALSLLLAAAGLYSVVAYLVSLRRKEMGIRLALGADPSAIVRLVVRQALTPTLIGALVGMAGAGTVASIVESRMYGAAGTDPVAFTGAAALMLSVMWISSWWPARQAGRVNPVDTLRTE